MKVFSAYFFLVFGLGLNYLFNIFVARELGVEYFGNYTYSLYLFNIASLIAVFSLDQAALKYIPQNLVKKEQITKTLQLFALCASGLVTSLYFMGVYFFVSYQFKTISLLFGFLIIPFVLITVHAAILQSLNIVVQRMALRYFYEPLIKIVLFFIVMKYATQSFAPVVAYLIALIAVNLIALVNFKRVVVSPFFEFTSERKLEIFKYCSGLSISNLIGIVSGRLDLLILGGFVSTGDLGVYSAAFQTAAMLSVVLQGIETIYVPILSKHIADNNKDLLRRDFQLCLRWSLIISSPILLVFLVYPEILAFPFGKGYENVALILSVFCVGQIFVLVFGGTSNILLSLLGYTKQVFYISLFQICCSSALLIVGAKYFGVMGAAIAVSITSLVVSVIRGVIAYKYSGVRPFDIYFFKAASSFVVVLLFGLMGKKVILFSGVLLLPLIFFLILWAVGLHPEDLAKLKLLLNRVKGLMRV